MKNTKNTLNWIIDILEQKNIDYRISGGLAARAHGAHRELADIDIEINNEDIQKIMPDVSSYVIYGPSRFLDENWDLNLLTLKHNDQIIDIASTEQKIFNKIKKTWEPNFINLQNFEIINIFDRDVRVEPKESLIAYKTKIGREVDLIDIHQINRL